MEREIGTNAKIVILKQSQNIKFDNINVNVNL